jgi:hypothetical protein
VSRAGSSVVFTTARRVAWDHSALLTVAATIQSIVNMVLLFVFGLGVRNRFRVK